MVLGFMRPANPSINALVFSFRFPIPSLFSRSIPGSSRDSLKIFLSFSSNWVNALTGCSSSSELGIILIGSLSSGAFRWGLTPP